MTMTQRGILADIWASLQEPGVNRGVLFMMHAVFIALISTLLFMLMVPQVDTPRVHVWVLLAIALFLYTSIVW